MWNAYATQVTRIAFSQGNEESRFVGRWKALIEERHTLELEGNPTTAIDRRLESLVGVPYPQLPEAAWDTADLMPAADRQAEYDRLTAKYGPREPSTTQSIDAPKRRRRA